MEQLASQFLGGGAESMQGDDLHGHVEQMMQAAPTEHVQGAIGSALSEVGASGFSQSVTEAAQNGGPAQRSAIGDLLMSAVARGGGSPNDALAHAGGSAGGFDPQQLGKLAGYVHQNHSDGLAGLLANRVGSGDASGSGMMSLLGNPMVRTIGMQLAKRIL